MQIGIVGAPNKGKSRFFSALTQVEVQVADYPFTTIEPNRGVALLRVPCAHVSLGLGKCDARGGHCKNGMREIAVQVLDVAGLVPDAHSGRGMGNKFLDDLRNADGFIQVVDASGRTDLDGNPANDFALEEEIGFLGKEMQAWLADVIARNYPKFRNRGASELCEAISGLGYGATAALAAAQAEKLPTERILWNEEQLERFARRLYAQGKPRVVAANKADLDGALERIKKFKTKTNESLPIIPCSAAYEYALNKAAARGLVDYASGNEDFSLTAKADERQGAALKQMQEFVRKNRGTGVARALHEMVFNQLGMMVVYPVEDEHRFSDRQGALLPDAMLVPAGTTAVQLAALVHTDLARGFVGAIDARTKMRVGRDHALGEGDIIKIIAAR